MTGLSALLSRLASLPGKAEAALDRAAREAAEHTAAAARSAAPVKTGALRASIQASPEAHGARTDAAAPYAAWVEQGAGRRRAQPFLRPALEESDYAARAARALKEGLR